MESKEKKERVFLGVDSYNELMKTSRLVNEITKLTGITLNDLIEGKRSIQEIVIKGKIKPVVLKGVAVRETRYNEHNNDYRMVSDPKYFYYLIEAEKDMNGDAILENKRLADLVEAKERHLTEKAKDHLEAISKLKEKVSKSNNELYLLRASLRDLLKED